MSFLPARQSWQSPCRPFPKSPWMKRSCPVASCQTLPRWMRRRGPWRMGRGCSWAPCHVRKTFSEVVLEIFSFAVCNVDSSVFDSLLSWFSGKGRLLITNWKLYAPSRPDKRKVLENSEKKSYIFMLQAICPFSPTVYKCNRKRFLICTPFFRCLLARQRYL